MDYNKEERAVRSNLVVKELALLSRNCRNIRKYCGNGKMAERLKALEKQIESTTKLLMEKHFLADVERKHFDTSRYKSLNKRELYKLSRRIFYAAKTRYDELLKEIDKEDQDDIVDQALISSIWLINLDGTTSNELNFR